MINIKTAEEIEILRQSNSLVTKTLAEVAKHVKPGITTNALDKLAEQYIRDHKGIPGFLGYNNYPKTLCTSVNSQIVHGIPSEYTLKEGDVLSIDCGVIFNGFYGDSAYTFEIGEISSEAKQLLKVTKESLFKGIEVAIEGKRVGDIGNAIQTYCESNGYSVVRELVGHGLGKKLHESPEVPNYGRKGTGQLLKSGMTICIEPMINMGKRNVIHEKDGWTIRTSDMKISAHFELPVLVAKGKAELLTTFAPIEEVLGI